MSRTSMALMGATALLMTAGAVQLASGHDLRGVVAAVATPAVSEAPVTDTVNRAGKADRAAMVNQPHVAMQTFAIQPSSLTDTSVLVRVPVSVPGKEANDVIAPRAIPSLTKSPVKPTIACEPSVSVLTDVAKELAPGRCLS